jgi:hypothetical protein
MITAYQMVQALKKSITQVILFVIRIESKDKGTQTEILAG